MTCLLNDHVMRLDDQMLKNVCTLVSIKNTFAKLEFK